MNQESKTVAETDEADLIAEITAIVPSPRAIVGNGDDAAVLPCHGQVVTSTDMLVANRHFRMEWSTGSDIGYRAAMQNFADIAAMGARCDALVVSLSLPKDLPVRWVREVATGLAQACDDAAHAWNTPVGIAGGDLTGGPVVTIAITALGTLIGDRPITRAGAQPGDVLAVAGTIGRSAAGLALAGPPAINAPRAAHTCWQTYLRPTPPLGEAAALCSASSAIDISDGLILDTSRLAQASAVSIDLDPLPLDPILTAVADLVAPEGEREAAVATWQFTGGEDHALLATFPPQQLPAGFSQIGTVHPLASDPVRVCGRPWRQRGGWDHFG
ncbi:MAG: thiamine-phosphate kinase [Bowdeniella nasicola]|nr:thiamine-phosphate kinase [Bowdeniella nasicola]